MKQFKRAWKKHRKLPKLYSQSSLRIPPEVQFIDELHVSVGSWSSKELDQFIDDMGYEKVKGSLYDKVPIVQEIIDETLEVTDTFCDINKIRELLKTKI